MESSSWNYEPQPASAERGSGESSEREPASVECSCCLARNSSESTRYGSACFYRFWPCLKVQERSWKQG